MLAIDSSKFFHVDSTQISASKLSSIMRVGFQMSIKKKKKHMVTSGKWKTLIKTTGFIHVKLCSLEYYLGFISP